MNSNLSDDIIRIDFEVQWNLSIPTTHEVGLTKMTGTHPSS